MRLRTDQKIVIDQQINVTKIIFANQLRGVAALLVMISHLGGVFILMSPVVSWVTSSPQQHVGRPAILYLTSWRWLDFGPLGVGIFFLISGFVIPISLSSQSSGRFLIARSFRIFPTFWVALTVEWLAVLAQSHLYHRPMSFTPPIYFENASLLDTALNNGYVDLVNWTLAIEVKFYILMAVMRRWIRCGRVMPLLGVGVFGLVVSIAENYGFINVSPVLASEPTFIGFMLIGTLFYYRMTGMVSYRKTFWGGVLLVVLFVASWRLGPMRMLFPFVTADYFYAIIIFCLAYNARGLFRPMIYLDFFADISFPFYLIHSVIGFSIMTFIMQMLKMPYAVALPCGFAGGVLLAYLLHIAIECPSMMLGKALSRMPVRNRGKGNLSAIVAAGSQDRRI